MWPKIKKQQDYKQEKLQDYEQDIQALREERDDLKAWCHELESRQQKQVFNQQVFKFWKAAISELKQLGVDGYDLAQVLSQKSSGFVSSHSVYADRRQALLAYVDGFTESYRMGDHSNEHVSGMRANAGRIVERTAAIDELAERMRLLSLNIAIESSHTDKQQLTDSIIASLREISSSSRQVSADINLLGGTIEADCQSTEDYFSTVTEGFIGFSRSISPLLAAADLSSGLLVEWAAVTDKWCADNLLQSIKVTHILWKFDLYSRLLGLDSEPVVYRQLHQLDILAGNSNSAAVVERALLSAVQIGEQVCQQHAAGNTDEVLSSLSILEDASKELYASLDALHLEMLAALK